MKREVDAVTKLYDFILWMVPKPAKFPRSQKFVLGDRMETLTLDILDLLIEAAYSKKKAHFLAEANLKLEKLRYFIRLFKDLKFLDLKSYENAAKYVDGIGVSIGGWLKYTKHETIQ